MSLEGTELLRTLLIIWFISDKANSEELLFFGTHF